MLFLAAISADFSKRMAPVKIINLTFAYWLKKGMRKDQTMTFNN